ncbi:MAG: hypothetical protein ACK41D_10370 [Rubricoccaceae bacterium]
MPASPELPRRRAPLLPPHIGWPLLIVLLLLLSITAAVGTAIAAHSDGGARLVEDAHYRR